jgi:hypothetical protein
MPKKKRRTKKQPESATTASTDDAPKTVMHRIFERAELYRLNQDLQKVIFLDW